MCIAHVACGSVGMCVHRSRVLARAWHAQVYELLEEEVAPYAAGAVLLSLAFLFSVFVLPLVLVGFAWYASSVGLTSLLDYLLELGKPDPLDF